MEAHTKNEKLMNCENCNFNDGECGTLILCGYFRGFKPKMTKCEAHIEKIKEMIDLRDKTEGEIVQVLSKNGFAYPTYKKGKKKYGVKGSSAVDADTFMQSLEKLIPHYPNVKIKI